MFLKTALTYLFYAVCCSVALWMTYMQLHKYFLNEDATSVQYKSFSTATENPYPDITICLLDYFPGNQFNRSILPYNITSAEVTNLLQGQVLEKTKIGKSSENVFDGLLNLIRGRNLSYEDLLNEDVKNVIAGYYMESTTPLDGCTQHILSAGSPNFKKTFDSTNYRCWTRNLVYRPGQVIKYEGIEIMPGVLKDSRTIQITLHHTNQSLRHDPLNVAQLMHINITDTDKLPSFIITVNHIKLIKRRHSSNQKCNQHLHNDDNRFLKEASKILGCIPIFWRDITESWKRLSNFSYCTDPRNYTFYHSTLGQRFDTRYLVYKEYDPPCSKMLVTYDISTREDENFMREYLKIEGDLLIKIIYRSDEYEYIKNLQKFDEESLFSQVGGFIGIMLGASLLHIPDILANIIPKLKRMLGRVENEVREKHRALLLTYLNIIN